MADVASSSQRGVRGQCRRRPRAHMRRTLHGTRRHRPRQRSRHGAKLSTRSSTSSAPRRRMGRDDVRRRRRGPPASSSLRELTYRHGRGEDRAYTHKTARLAARAGARPAAPALPAANPPAGKTRPTTPLRDDDDRACDHVVRDFAAGRATPRSPSRKERRGRPSRRAGPPPLRPADSAVEQAPTDRGRPGPGGGGRPRRAGGSWARRTRPWRGHTARRSFFSKNMGRRPERAALVFWLVIARLIHAPHGSSILSFAGRPPIAVGRQVQRAGGRGEVRTSRPSRPRSRGRSVWATSPASPSPSRSAVRARRSG